jgi:hypothetical protein
MASRFFSSFAVAALASAATVALESAEPAAGLRVLISVPASQTAAASDGRMLLLLSTDEHSEPRFQVSDNDRSAQIFGLDVDGLKPGEDAIVDASVLGYPVRTLGDIEPGDYWVQALLHVYETFTRSDGHTVKLPPDRGEGQQWSSAPGNMYSVPVKMRLDPSSETPLRISLD